VQPILIALCSHRAVVGDGLVGEARQAMSRTLQAVDDFAKVTGGSATSERCPNARVAQRLPKGLAVAAQLLAADAGTQVVVVSASGFDTHANQT